MNAQPAIVQSISSKTILKMEFDVSQMLKKSTLWLKYANFQLPDTFDSN